MPQFCSDFDLIHFAKQTLIEYKENTRYRYVNELPKVEREPRRTCSPLRSPINLNQINLDPKSNEPTPKAHGIQ